MSEVLARIRVRETAGIRRFLYPLTAIVPSDWPVYEKTIVIKEKNGKALPTTFLEAPDKRGRLKATRLMFADSLAPHETKDYVAVFSGEEQHLVADPIGYTSFDMEVINDQSIPIYSGLRTQQDRVLFGIAEIGRPEMQDVSLASVVYDGVEHLREPLRILLNGALPLALDMDTWGLGYAYDPFFASVDFDHGEFDGRGFAFRTQYRVPFCKSWVQIDHILQKISDNSTVTFSLPLVTQEKVPTCDFGVGGGTFAKIAGESVAWSTRFSHQPFADWKITTIADGSERVDYQGQTRTKKEFASQCWFHWIEQTKALAVAITKVPERCREMTVRLTHEGEVTIAFRLGDAITGPAEFGVCYHFLNDVPAIAAATNPQSILLPPRVEVLPV